MISTPQRLRVLLIAEACNPQWTSVPLVGYQLVRALADHPRLEVTLATQVRNRPGLESVPLHKQVPIHFLDTEAVAAPLNRLSDWLRGGRATSWTTSTAFNWPMYIAFERQLFRQLKGPLTSGQFDLIHRITPLTPTVGSPLAGWVETPMVMGPLNGGLPWPAEYPDLRKQEREWLVPLRQAYRYLPYYQATFRHLAGVIAGSRHTETAEVPASFRGERLYLPENGVDPDRFPLGDAWPAPAGRFRFITVGRLVPYKGVDLVLEAMAASPALRQCELAVVGDGPQRAALEEQVRQAGLENSVRFLGWLDQKALAGELRASQSFVFPSLREFGGGVVLEAMAVAVPPIVVAYGGPGELVTPDCGVVLPMKPRETLVPLLREAMEALAGDPARCAALGGAAARKVREEFTWDAKARRVVEFYDRVLESKA